MDQWYYIIILLLILHSILGAIKKWIEAGSNKIIDHWILWPHLSILQRVIRFGYKILDTIFSNYVTSVWDKFSLIFMYIFFCGF